MHVSVNEVANNTSTLAYSKIHQSVCTSLHKHMSWIICPLIQELNYYWITVINSSSLVIVKIVKNCSEIKHKQHLTISCACICFCSPFSLFFLVLSRWSLSMMRTCLSLARSLMKACLSRASVVGRCRWFLTRQLSTKDRKRFDLWQT